MPIIDELYAFITEPNEPGNEDIVAAQTERGLIPLVSTKEHLEALRSLALQLVPILGREIKLFRFSNREELESLGICIKS